VSELIAFGLASIFLKSGVSVFNVVLNLVSDLEILERYFLWHRQSRVESVLVEADRAFAAWTGFNWGSFF